MQGMGWSCIEELVWGDGQHAWVKPGQLFTRGPGTYKVRVSVCWCGWLQVGGGMCRLPNPRSSACLLLHPTGPSLTPSPGLLAALQIPTANDIPVDFRVTLLRNAPCDRTPMVHSSKAVGEPPFFLGKCRAFLLGESMPLPLPRPPLCQTLTAILPPLPAHPHPNRHICVLRTEGSLLRRPPRRRLGGLVQAGPPRHPRAPAHGVRRHADCALCRPRPAAQDQLLRGPCWAALPGNVYCIFRLLARYCTFHCCLGPLPARLAAPASPASRQHSCSPITHPPFACTIMCIMQPMRSAAAQISCCIVWKPTFSVVIYTPSPCKPTVLPTGAGPPG